LSVEDRLVIQEMIAEYSYTYDSNDANGFANLFVEDGVFEVFVPGKTAAVFVLQSRAAIYEWAKQRGSPPCSHQPAPPNGNIVRGIDP
jgi:hypothetical protein